MNNETIREKIKNNDFVDIENWDTSGVTNMCQLFYKKTTFNKGLCFSEHPRHVVNFTGVPFANVLVERLVECKHV
jgi:hypothetical protein